MNINAHSGKMIYLNHLIIFFLILKIASATNEIQNDQSTDEKIRIMIEYFQWKSLRFGIIINCYENSGDY